MELGSSSDFARLKQDLTGIQEALQAAGLDGWLLYDLHARNTVTARLTGLGDLSRRYFVLVPAQGQPHAIVHGIEEGPWAQWPWTRQRYSGWRELQSTLRTHLQDRRVAMEISELDNVPAMDLVPVGVVELVRNCGATVVSSGELVTRFYSCWNEADVASHKRASAALVQVVETVFQRIAQTVAAGKAVTEATAQAWVNENLVERGVGVEPGCIVAGTLGAADPHYAPAGAGAALEPGDLILIDLWGKERAESVFADQTWMGYLGAGVPDRASELFAIIRDARDAAVHFLADAWRAGRPVQGGEVDDVARAIIERAGYGAAFIHRTGHSIDQSIHGMGPNIDNLETRETRVLIPGVGFSIEPGIYLKGEIGLRTEINVYMSPGGPEVTVPRPQTEIFALLS